ncbi:response regulator [Tabrizicola piscis]|uniref:Regulatory protein VirG n=1 Tax=Tabrizicola piscis TaxID=2494374 RepID=A0A3S8U795_9RHOB|nr:response regulator [Tabrizicola piscis]AZL59526.1 response regulator [Tabrizicola piscis]
MSTLTHILLVEDDPAIGSLVCSFLERSGFRTTHLPHGKGVERVLTDDPPHLVLLDLLLPGEGGLSIARQIRMSHPTPIIMLTAMSEERDRISGLDLGADDYVTKPFSTRELVSRIRAVLRRTESAANGRKLAPVSYSFAGWELDAKARELFDPVGVRVELTSAEFELLRTFCKHPGEVLSRDALMKLAQGRRVEPYDRSVDTLVSRIRSKIEPEEASPSLIKTVRHSGYVFTVSVIVTEQS